MNNYQLYNYDWYSNRAQNNYYSPSRNNQDNIFDPKDGFEKGNMFMNLYSQYNNYQPTNLKPRNEQEKLLFNIQSISFAAHDINLYLDTHPQSTSKAIAKLIDLQISSTKNYLTRLIELGFVITHGANKNRTYSISKND